jgi:hypothetical protein
MRCAIQVRPVMAFGSLHDLHNTSARLAFSKAEVGYAPFYDGFIRNLSVDHRFLSPEET